MRVQRCRTGMPMLGLVFLAALFFLGLLLGRSAALRVPESTLLELESYLKEFLTLERSPLSETFFPTVILYARYPLMAFFFGFTWAGVVLLPLAGMVFAFFLSFSVCCFTAVFGSGGVLLALAVFGLRCVLTVPCFFLLAVSSLERSCALALAGKHGRRAEKVSEGKRRWLHLAAAAAVLSAGVLMELLLAPHLLRAALHGILN